MTIVRAALPAELGARCTVRLRMSDGRYVTFDLNNTEALETLDPVALEALRAAVWPGTIPELQTRPDRIDHNIDTKPRETRTGTGRTGSR